MVDNNIKKSSNPCTRCGKDRIEGKTWTEEVVEYFGKTTLIHTEMVCPDPECQKIVEEKLEEQKKKTKDMQAAKDERIKKAQDARKKPVIN
ncbi:MAG TPA: hypothetical protein VG917_03100 [Patescibacteria group bacterium]|nr:hypothetical protein [Patescibacteria group bacterium]